MDANYKPDHGTPMWNETRWIGAVCPDSGVGLFLHAGRLRGALDWWWAQTVVYLPDGRLVVDRSWGRNSDDSTRIRAGAFDLRMSTDGWKSGFDGVGELTTTEALVRGPRGSGTGSVPLRFDITGIEATPVWDMYTTITELETWATDMHIQQGFRTTGTLTVGEETFSLDGFGFKDHSTGVRDWTQFVGHHFTLAMMPGYTIHEIAIIDERGGWRTLGTLFEDGVQTNLEHAELPALQDLAGAPHGFDLVVTPIGQAPRTLRVEVLHTFPMTITDNNDNINGIEWEAADPMVFAECIVRLADAHGAVGYGHVERALRRSQMPQPVTLVSVSARS